MTAAGRQQPVVIAAKTIAIATKRTTGKGCRMRVMSLKQSFSVSLTADHCVDKSVVDNNLRVMGNVGSSKSEAASRNELEKTVWYEWRAASFGGTLTRLEVDK
jgi:hypothetical protein